MGADRRAAPDRQDRTVRRSIPPATSSSPRSTAGSVACTARSNVSSARASRSTRRGVPSIPTSAGAASAARFTPGTCDVPTSAPRRSSPDAPVTLEAHVEEGEVGNAALSSPAASRSSGSFQLMRRDLTEPLPDVPLPDGLEVRRRSPGGPSDRSAMPRTRRSASHWGAREPYRPRLRATRSTARSSTPALWVVAWDGDLVRRRCRELDLARRERDPRRAIEAGSSGSALAGRGVVAVSAER